MNKVYPSAAAAIQGVVRDGQLIAVGGFGLCGIPEALIDAVREAGIKNLTQNLGREWGTKGVRVNALRPGFFPTEWNRKNFISAERETAILSHTPMGRFGEPSELLGATLWLASDAASFVTGAEICVDGGFSSMTV